ncbi:hypothetical protein SDJN02_06410, partial [Cucurbita argyrosperma subsp. argyrosperma]
MLLYEVYAHECDHDKNPNLDPVSCGHQQYPIFVVSNQGLAPKTKNIVVAGGLTAFVFGVYFYTMRAVGGSDELQVAIDQFEAQKDNKDSNV